MQLQPRAGGRGAAARACGGGASDQPMQRLGQLGAVGVGGDGQLAQGGEVARQPCGQAGRLSVGAQPPAAELQLAP